MITIIFGPPGVGKTALMTYFALNHLEPIRARDDVLASRALIRVLNDGGYNFTEPTRHLVYSDYAISYRAYNCAPRRSYLVNGYYLGLPNTKGHPIYLLPPNSKIFLSEGQRYFNSRMSNRLEDFISRYYEMHRHYGLDIYIDVQRAQLIDVNIRELARFIEVQDLKLRYRHDDIVSCTWTVKEFDSSFELDKYFEQGKPAQLGRMLQYKYKGNIFDYYKSANCFPAFLSGAAGSDYSYLQHYNVGYTVEDIEYYNANLGMSVPNTYYKDKSR